jgi:hypothetical protein
VIRNSYRPIRRRTSQPLWRPVAMALRWFSDVIDCLDVRAGRIVA